MGLEAEAFYIDGRQTGALVRETGDGVFRTTVAFLLPDGHLVHLHQETRYDGDVLGWTSYRYVDSGSDVDITGVPPDDARGAGPRPVPSYAAHLLLVSACWRGRIGWPSASSLRTATGRPLARSSPCGGGKP